MSKTTPSSPTPKSRRDGTGWEQRIPYLRAHAPKGDDHTLLYRFFDASGRLLYVGITDNPHARWAAHAHKNADGWWLDVCVVHTEWFTNRREAEAAEIASIRTELPIHNVSHNLRPGPGRRVRSMYLHPMAREQFGDQPFTYRELAEQTGVPYGTVALYGRRLAAKGAFRKVGDVKTGTRSRRGLFVAVEVPSRSDASPVKAPLPEPREEPGA